MNRDDDIFAEALDLPASERAAYLDRACAGDPAQRARLEALLATHDSASSFLEQPVTARPPTSPEEAPGTVIGPYTLRQRLGEGGCGVVWLAEQTAPLRRTVALKVIKPGMDTRSVIARFESERQTLALMSHPDIARVYDAGTTAAGRPYFVMEYVEGIPITRFCDEHSLPMERRLELFSRVCLALQHAHQKGIIHRDLKPSNILVALRDGEPAPKIIDFGIAKATAGRLTDETLVTELGLFLGTPAYMSPEQAELRDADIDTRSDVYALGVLLYELLTGRPPYDPKELVRAGLLEIRRIIREVDPPRPSTVLTTLTEADRDTVARLRGAAAPHLTAALRGDLDWIVMRCLEKDRDRRYGTAAALAEDVRRHLRQEPVEARPPHALYRLRKFTARHRLACASAALVALSLIGGVIASTVQARRAQRAERVAATQRDNALAAQQAEAVARTDAQRRQDQAEDLLTFMLGDFRAELQKIGRLEPLDAVGAKALAYFAALDPRDLTDTALTRQAKALTQLGEVRLEQARFAEAEQAFTAAYTRAAALASRHPTNGDMLFERGQAEFWIGFVARRRGDTATQRTWLVRYRDTALALATVEGPTPRAQLEVVYGHHNLAVLDADTGHLAEAQAGFLAEKAALEPMLTATPSDSRLQLSLAEIAFRLGTVAERDGRLAEAAGYYAERDGAYAGLRRIEPATARWRFEQAQCRIFVGQIDMILGKIDSATEAFDQAGALLDELVSLDGNNTHWLAARFGVWLMRTQIALARPTSNTGETLAAAARRGLEALHSIEPGSVLFARRLILALRLEAQEQLAGERIAPATATIARALSVADRLLDDKRADTWTLHDCAHAYILSGRIALARKDPMAARAAWAKAVDLLGTQIVDSNDWRMLEPAALAARLEDRNDIAGPLITRLKSFGYHPIDPFIASTLGLADQPETSTTTKSQ